MKFFGVEVCNWNYSSIKPKQKIKENNIDKSLPPMNSGTPMPPCKTPRESILDKNAILKEWVKNEKTAMKMTDAELVKFIKKHVWGDMKIGSPKETALGQLLNRFEKRVKP